MSLDRPTIGNEQDDKTFTIEMVWDDGTDATAVALDVPLQGARLRVGPEAGWLPAHLLTLAAASSFMSALLRLAAGAHVDVLGFVSNSKLRVPGDREQVPALTLSPCIVVRSEEDAKRIGALCDEAILLSDVCRTLQGRLRLEPDIEVVASASEAREL